MGDFYAVLNLGPSAMVAILSIILFLDCQMMGVTLTEHVKNGNLDQYLAVPFWYSSIFELRQY